MGPTPMVAIQKVSSANHHLYPAINLKSSPLYDVWSIRDRLNGSQLTETFLEYSYKTLVQLKTMNKDLRITDVLVLLRSSCWLKIHGVI